MPSPSHAPSSVRIATRNSPLALWQAKFVQSQLKTHHPDLEIELVGFTTKGDVLLDTPLAKIGGKGLFVKELELAMLNGEADIAVHSMKDVPMEFPDGLDLKVICKREDPRDAFVSNRYKSFDALPDGAVVGTSSLRRKSQLLAARPDLSIRELRGNVNTRLRKLDEGEYDAIILAAAGLLRLEMTDRIADYLSPEASLPAGGQGAVGIEARLSDDRVAELIRPLHHQATASCVLAERAMNRHLQGGCQVPIACFAELADNHLSMRGLVASLDGTELLSVSGNAPVDQAEILGVRLANELLALGADRILEEVYGDG